MDTKRDLGTVILTSSITKKDEIVGKMCDDGNSVVSNNVTYSSVGSWINSVMYDIPENETISDCVVY
ncbi:hypothetical protein AV274_3301 [Blastocystis sp. ATCC 50177/Nand II]|uniref:Uncharacterized protein n=1 Tax=Blastocystis sp. subtype 1 (strain ATCC 50177 / NandII) TaxID=478820 RepID=A0A196SG57_BLAHN|nr:hypothetical protein AV274_3301 [Blastocystis sp. ATCC 50177/Nand II]